MKVTQGFLRDWKGGALRMDLEHEKRLTEVEQRSKSNAHRLDEVEKRQNDLSELVGTVKVLATKEERVESDVKEIKEKVTTLINRPAKRWESLVTDVVKLIVAAIIGFILARIGL
jgi:seryl-tRNA synthetase